MVQHLVGDVRCVTGSSCWTGGVVCQGAARLRARRSMALGWRLRALATTGLGSSVTMAAMAVFLLALMSTPAA